MIGPPVYVKEKKTTSEDISLGSVYWKRLKMDVQISTYIAAVRALGFNVIGVLYDVLAKPEQRPQEATPLDLRKYTKPTKKDPISRLYANQREVDETPQEYFERCLEAIKSDPDRFYQRGIITRLESEMEEAQLDVWQTAISMRDSKRLRVFPRNPDACVQWSRACDYLSVCCGEADINDPLLFKQKEKKHSELDSNDEDLLTQSSLRAYRSCQRKYFYRYEMRMRPLAADAVPLRTGKSVHAALEAWDKSGGDLEAAIACLDTVDAYRYAKEKAMLIGYHARWEKPVGVVAVEKEWIIDLVNPETGARSKTFRLGGRVDSIVEVRA